MWAARRKPEKVVAGPSVTLLQVNIAYFEVTLKPLPFSFFLNGILALLDPHSEALKDYYEYFAK